MTGKEATAVLEQKLHLRRAQLCAAPKGFCVMPGTARFTPGKQYLREIDVPNMGLTLMFTEGYPFNPNAPESLTSILYGPQLATDADRNAFMQEIVEKYGHPVQGNEFSGTWCRQGVLQWHQTAKYSCTDPQPELKTGWMGFSGLELTDFTVEPEERKLWENTATTRPPL